MTPVDTEGLAWARSCQQSLMTATCAITAPGDGWVWDGTTGTDILTAGTTIYSGPCRIQPDAETVTVQAGGQDVPVRRWVAAVPWDTAGISPGDTFTVSSSTDPDLTGARMVVVDVEGQTVALTARRLKLSAAPAGGGP